MTKFTKTCLNVLVVCAGLLVAQGSNAAIIQVNANLSGTNTWRNTNEYVLNGFIYVLQGGVLNIEPGTVVRGRAGTGLNSAALFITRGAKIFANGTRAKPIVFTSETDDLLDPGDIPLYTRNLWGGVVIFGNSVLNTPSDVNGRTNSPKYDIFEGLPNDEVNGQRINQYGGNDDNDNSGVFRYVSIRHSSTTILPNKEINGLSLCAVGRGTKIENVEIFGAGDDSVEFFGGTVNTKYMLSIFCDDDNFDIDQGYRGKNQFWFSIQAPDRKDQGGEWNGEPSGIAVSNTPIANFEIYNATYIGAGPNSTGNRALLSREYAAPKVFNSIFTEYNIGVNIDANSYQHFLSGVASICNNIFWNFASNGVAQPYWQNANAQNALTTLCTNNMFVDPMLRSIGRTNIPPFRLDPRPQAGSPALTSDLTAPNDGFYTPVAYKGAFSDLNWASDWTFAAEACLITGEGAGTPGGPVVDPDPCLSPISLSIVRNGSNVEITFTSVAGGSYQVQSKTDLNAPTWDNEGSALSGTGGILTYSTLTGGVAKFFRVFCQ